MKLADLATGSDWIVWIVFAIFAVLSIILLSGHGSWFISGYNTASREEKEKELLRALLIQFCKLEFLDAYNMRKKLNFILNIVLSFTAIL